MTTLPRSARPGAGLLLGSALVGCASVVLPWSSSTVVGVPDSTSTFPGFVTFGGSLNFFLLVDLFAYSVLRLPTAASTGASPEAEGAYHGDGAPDSAIPDDGRRPREWLAGLSAGLVSLGLVGVAWAESTTRSDAQVTWAVSWGIFVAGGAALLVCLAAYAGRAATIRRPGPTALGCLAVAGVFEILAAALIYSFMHTCFAC